jgi:anti-anti-sigma regulatory factor
MSSDLEINVRLGQATAELRLVGELTSTTLGSLVRCLTTMDSVYGRVVLDLADLHAIDSVAAYGLVALQEELAVGLHQLEVRNVTGDAARVLELTGAASELR